MRLCDGWVRDCRGSDKSSRPMANERQTYRLRAPGLRPRGPRRGRARRRLRRPRDRRGDASPSPACCRSPPRTPALLRIPENLRECRRCDQLIGLDVSDCPHCGLRQDRRLDGRGREAARAPARLAWCCAAGALVAAGCGDDETTTDHRTSSTTPAIEPATPTGPTDASTASETTTPASDDLDVDPEARDGDSRRPRGSQSPARTTPRRTTSSRPNGLARGGVRAGRARTNPAPADRRLRAAVAAAATAS